MNIEILGLTKTDKWRKILPKKVVWENILIFFIFYADTKKVINEVTSFHVNQWIIKKHDTNKLNTISKIEPCGVEQSV